MTLDVLCWYAGLMVDIIDADPEGIANAQKSLGLGQEDKARRVRWDMIVFQACEWTQYC